jgi:flavin-binding protein dodecin
MPPITLIQSISVSEGKEIVMSNSVYKVIELVGTSQNSWEDAATRAVETAGKSLRELRIAEIAKLDMKVENSKIVAYRARVKVSFKYGVE